MRANIVTKAKQLTAVCCTLLVSSFTAPACLAQANNAPSSVSQSNSASTAVETKPGSIITESKTNTTTTVKFNGLAQHTEGHRPRIGLALGGGGTRGSAHVGVLKVLVREGIPIDMIAGTSIGSVVGGLFCADVSLDSLAELFDRSELMKAYMPIPLAERLAFAPIMFTPRLLGYHPYDGLYDGKKFTKFFNRLLGDNPHKIEELHKPFGAICTNLIDGKAYRISSGDLGTAIQASSAVPGLKKPVFLLDSLYCDGGLVCNLPVKQVKEMGADFVIAVDIDETLNEEPLKAFRKVGSVSKQALKIQLADQDQARVSEADILIHPDVDGVGLVSRKKNDGKRGIEAGIVAAEAALPELKRKLALYGIVPKPLKGTEYCAQRAQ